MLRRAVLLTALVGAFLIASGQALAIPVNACNTVISASGAYQLVTNLNCPAGTAITISADAVNLDLAGHRVSGQGTGLVGIDVLGGSDDVLIFGPGTIRGFDVGIEGGACGAVVPPITDTDNLTIDNVIVRDSGSDGIRLCTSEGDAQVRFSRVIGGLRGIDTAGGIFGSAGSVEINQSLVRDTTFGILVGPTDFGSTSVLGTTVQNASGTAVAVSLGGNGAASAEISDSTVDGCGSCLRGITVSGQGNAVIARTTVRTVDEEGIAVSGGGPIGVTIEDSTVGLVGGSPFFDGAILIQNLGLDSAVGILSTAVRNVTGGPGIHLICADGVGVHDSLVRNAGGDGIAIDDAAPAGSPCTAGRVSQADVVTGTLVRGSGGNGISIAAGRGYTLMDNVALGSGLDGFLIGSAVTESLLTHNLARDSGDDGFQLDSADLELTDNVAGRNAGYGYETNFAGPVLADNGNTAANNAAGNCSDPSDLPATTC
jgi:hypothetical protein